MERIRVLVVDDAVAFRRAVAQELGNDPMLDVVGTAANGRIALARMQQVSPDIVILDVEMPEMDGLAFLKEVRKTYPRLPIIMFSALTERGAATTLDALALGATDYFTKPACAGGLEAALDIIRRELIPQIKALCAGALARRSVPIANRYAAAPIAAPGQPSQRREVHVVAIGTSTGGPNALAELFAQLPADFPAPIVVVQHMPPMFTRLLAERLTAKSRLRVHEGTSGAVLAPGQAWIAPGDYHMILTRDRAQVRLALHQEPPENSCRPAADVLFRSVAQVYGGNALGVILTGMGQDGLRGCETLRSAGAPILAQDEASSVVWGMPGAVARAGLADRVLALDLMADEIIRRAQK